MPYIFLELAGELLYVSGVHTVVETAAYLSSAKNAAMTAAEMEATVKTVATSPKAGDLIVGSGGCRKLRLAGRGQGESGGYRLVTYYAGKSGYVYLVAVLSKGSTANFSAAQVAAMAKMTKSFA